MPEIMRCKTQSLRKFQFKYGLCQRDEVGGIIQVNKNIHMTTKKENDLERYDRQREK